MTLSDSLLTLSLALAAEAAVGYPHRLYTWIGHPVTWIGQLIKRLDRSLNQDVWSFSRRRFAGVFALLLLLAVTGLAALATEMLFRSFGLWVS